MRISRCTWETCGFGTLSCKACQQCWSVVQCSHPSWCSTPPALARCHQPLAPKMRGMQRGTKRAVAVNVDVHVPVKYACIHLSFLYILYCICVVRVETDEARREVESCWLRE